MTETAWSTSNLDTIAAYTKAQNDYRNAGIRIARDAAALGKNKGVLVSRGIFGDPDEIVGLAADNPDDPPQGWTYIKGRDRLEPRRGKAGDAARAWLDDHKMPDNDPRGVLREHGLPTHARTDRPGGGWTMGAPMVFLYDGTLWAKYRGEISNSWIGTDTPTWEQQPLSAFYAAKEALEAEQATAQEAAA